MANCKQKCLCFKEYDSVNDYNERNCAYKRKDDLVSYVNPREISQTFVIDIWSAERGLKPTWRSLCTFYMKLNKMSEFVVGIVMLMVWHN